MAHRNHGSSIIIFRIPFIFSEEKDDSKDGDTNPGLKETFPETFPDLHGIFAQEGHGVRQQDQGEEKGKEEGHNASDQDQKAKGEDTVLYEAEKLNDSKDEHPKEISEPNVAKLASKATRGVKKSTGKVSARGKNAAVVADSTKVECATGVEGATEVENATAGVGATETASVAHSDLMTIKSEDHILQLFNDSIKADVKPIESGDKQTDMARDVDENETTDLNNAADNVCPVCKAVLDSKRRLIFHMRKHIAKPVCYLCGKRLKSMEVLKGHLRRIHNQELYEMKPEHATAMPVSVFCYHIITHPLCFANKCVEYSH